MRVLIADLSPGIVGMVVKYLTADGFVVDKASDGGEALAKIQEDTPDILLCDVFLPVMGGIELTKTLRSDARFADLKIIQIHAGMSLAADQKEWLDELWGTLAESGCDGFLTKPFNPAALLQMVDFVVKRGRFAE